ncbi:Rsl24d1, partial [Symbiodinium sp. KB8]
DESFEFEKRRNIPVKYDRPLMQETIRTMKRVAEIRKRREDAFFEKRMKIKKAKQKKEDAAEIAQNIHLITPALKKDGVRLTKEQFLAKTQTDSKME